MNKGRWVIILTVCALLVAMAGLVVGRRKEKAYLASMNTHGDFMLMDDTENFFELSKMPAGKRLLMIFTPDGIPTNSVAAFHAFSRHLTDFAKQGIEVKLVSRTNKDIVMNFREAARFEGRVLFDVGGTVGRIATAWPTNNLVNDWTYILTDNKFNILYGARAPEPMSYEELAGLFGLKP